MNKIITSIIIFFSIVGSSYATNGHVVQQVVIPQRIVQFDERYINSTDYYYSVGEKLQKDKQQETDAQIEFYKGQIDMLLKVLAAQAKPAVTPTPTPTPDPITPPAPAPTPTPPTDNGEYKVTELDKKVFGIFSANCAKCHGDTKQDGGLALVKDGALQLVDVYDRVEIFDRVYGTGLDARGKTRMPKGSAALADEDVEALRLWMIEESDRHRTEK